MPKCINSPSRNNRNFLVLRSKFAVNATAQCPSTLIHQLDMQTSMNMRICQWLLISQCNGCCHFKYCNWYQITNKGAVVFLQSNGIVRKCCPGSTNGRGQRFNPTKTICRNLNSYGRVKEWAHQIPTNGKCTFANHSRCYSWLVNSASNQLTQRCKCANNPNSGKQNHHTIPNRTEPSRIL